MLLRNLKLFFRDKAGVFFSFMAVIILFGLYTLFLGDLYKQDIPFPNAEVVMVCWLMAGVVTIATITTVMGAFGIMVDDRSKKIDRDFFAAPISRWKITAGYLLNAVLIGFVLTILTFIFAEIYIVAKGGTLLSILQILQLLGYIFLSVLCSCSMLFLLVSFFKTQNAFGVASSILGTMIGFVTGMYIPIGTMPESVGWVIKCVPLSHSVALIRQVFMATATQDWPQMAVDGFNKSMGVYYWYGDTKAAPWVSIVILLATTLIFFGLSVLNMSRKRK